MSVCSIQLKRHSGSENIRILWRISSFHGSSMVTFVPYCDGGNVDNLAVLLTFRTLFISIFREQ
jgi:hypothetical protein